MNENETEVCVQTEETPTENLLPQKEKRKFVQVSQKEFIDFLRSCKKEKLPQSKMKGEYARRFGGAEETAIQKYATLIKQYREAIELRKKKEPNEKILDEIQRLTNAVAQIELPDGREGRSSRPRDNTEEGKLSFLLSLIDGDDVPEESDESDEIAKEEVSE